MIAWGEKSGARKTTEMVEVGQTSGGADRRRGDGALAARLRRELEGEVLFDRFSRGRYSTDASISALAFLLRFFFLPSVFRVLSSTNPKLALTFMR